MRFHFGVSMSAEQFAIFAALCVIACIWVAVFTRAWWEHRR